MEGKRLGFCKAVEAQGESEDQVVDATGEDS